MANITGKLIGHTLRRSVEEVIWSWIGSKLREKVLDWIQMERKSLIVGHSQDYFNFVAIWMGLRAIGLTNGLKA